MTTGNVPGSFSCPSLGARDALWHLTIQTARAIAAPRGLTVADQKPHEITPVFGQVTEHHAGTSQRRQSPRLLVGTGVITPLTRYRAFHLRHPRLRRWLPAWRVYVKLP